MSTLAERLAELAHGKPHGWQAELARACGVKPPSVAGWLSGATKTLKGNNLLMAAKFFGVSPSWLASGIGSRVPRDDGSHVEVDMEAHPDLERVRRVKLRLEAGVNGFGVEPDESDGMPIFFRSDWLQQRGYKPYYLVAIKVMGNSMEPTLYPDDMVVINTADTEPKDGKVFAINYEGEAVIKRMVRDEGTWWLASDNPDIRRFPRKACANESCLILGQVIHKQSEQI